MRDLTMCTTPDLEILKYLHEHTFKRLLWYRDEIWRVTTPIWGGFGAFTIAMLSFLMFLREKNVVGMRDSLMLISGCSSVVLCVVYFHYIHNLYKSVKSLNILMSDRELALSTTSKCLNFNEGYCVDSHKYTQHKVYPGLEYLFVIINGIVSVATLALIYELAP